MAKDGNLLLPAYGGWSGQDNLSQFLLDSPYNSGAKVFGAEVCAVCRDGQKVLGCVTFTFDLKSRRLSVPDGKKLSAQDLALFGAPGGHADGVGASGFLKGCSDAGTLWNKALKEWKGRLGGK